MIPTVKQINLITFHSYFMCVCACKHHESVILANLKYKKDIISYSFHVIVPT